MSHNKIIGVSKLGSTWATLDPFLFSVHHLDHYPAGNAGLGPVSGLEGRNIGQDFAGKDGWSMYHGQHVPGFPYHPHRGFETITVVEQGFADHSDSLGATGRFGKGDVQWMTAGKGVQHSEMFPLLNTEEGNTLELFQIWLNLPAKSKMVEPNYQMLWSEDIPVAEHTDEAGKWTRIKIIAGNLGTQTALAAPPNSWAADEANHLAVWLIHMEAGATWTLPKSVEGINKALYLYKGETLVVEGNKIDNYQAIQVDPSEDISLQAGAENVSMLLLQAKPIKEPVVQHGPFVMNSEEGIRQAFEDFRATQYGGWPWPQKEYIHPREKGRFALYPDGSLEEK